jgi:hypothetical protein
MKCFPSTRVGEASCFVAVLLVAVSCLAQELPAPTQRILPEDIVQSSIELLRFSTNSFGVRWTYTEAGANKMLAFRESHEGQRTRTVIGNFESPPSEIQFRPMPPVFTNYAQWKEGWLKRRTDKFMGVSEAEAKEIVAGLKITATVPAGNSSGLSAKVIKVEGGVRYVDTNGTTWKPLKPGTELRAGFVVQTDAENASAIIGLDEMEAGGQVTIRMFTDSILKLIGLSSQKAGSVLVKTTRLEVAVGQIRVRLAGVADYEFEFSGANGLLRVTPARNQAAAQQTVFAFDGAGTLTVLKGSVNATAVAGAPKLVHAGEQLRKGADEVTNVPLAAPESGAGN